MKTIHIVPGTGDVANGMVVVAKLLAKEQGEAEVVDLNDAIAHLSDADEVWVHGMWLPREWQVCRATLKAGKRLVRMTHGALSPVYLKHQSRLKKRLVSPIEKWLFKKASRIVATCEAEKGWIQSYLGKHCPPVIVTDIKRFFKLGNGERGTGNTGKTGQTSFPTDRPLHLLYLGRRHPLKGLSYLESALTTYYNMWSKPQVVGVPSDQTSATYYNKCSVEFCVVSNAFGEELEKVWQWCDVLVLPTLSENFGLVIAEALARGKRVITTDGAPAWGDGKTYGGRLIYLNGYRDGSLDERVRLLKKAIGELTCQF